MELHTAAAHAIAHSGAMPTPAELDQYWRTNSCIAAVLPYAAQLGDPAFAVRCVATFRSVIESTLTDADAVLRLDESTCTLLYLESCGVAIRKAETPESDWWLTIVKRALGDTMPWNHHPSSVDVQNAAWLLTAASVAVLGEYRDSGTVRIDLLDMIGAVCDCHLSLLFWESGNSREWLTLTDCLARALALDSERGQRRLGELAREVRSPELLCKVLKGGGRVLSDGELATLVKQLRERIAFYEHLRQGGDHAA